MHPRPLRGGISRCIQCRHQMEGGVSSEEEAAAGIAATTTTTITTEAAGAGVAVAGVDGEAMNDFD